MRSDLVTFYKVIFGDRGRKTLHKPKKEGLKGGELRG
jgi:hypothetical protein